MRRFLALFFLMILMCENVCAEEATLPKVNAQGAILMDMESGRVLWERKSKEPMAMASTTKIMTAIITLENADLEDTVVVSKKASQAPPVKMHLSENEEIRLKDLLYALMLQSSNDAAVAIAEHVGDSVENFCDMMTIKAKELGCEDTLFVTPNGLDAGDHHSTAYDMALITRYALKNEQLLEIISTPSVQFQSSKCSYSVANKNRLLNEYDGAIGVKTGFTGKAGHCFVGAAKRGDTTLISVVLASGWGTQGKAQKWIDTKRILDYGFDNYERKQVINEGDYAKDIFVDRAKVTELKLYYKDGLILPMRAGEEKEITIEYEVNNTVEAPIIAGTAYGKAKVYMSGELIDEIDLVCKDNIERHDFETSMKKIINSWLKIGDGGIIK